MRDTVTLEKLRFGLRRHILASDIGINQSIDVFIDDLSGDIVAEIRGFVWAERPEDRGYTFQWADGWIQALKERWFPTWVLKKWPIRYHREHVDVQAIYPTFKPAIPDQQFRLRLIRHDPIEFFKEPK